MSDYYEILQCDKDSSYENIKTKYHNLIRKFHPDKTGNDNTEQFINVREAWKTVCDPTKKRIYDESQLQEQKSKLFSESCDFNDRSLKNCRAKYQQKNRKKIREVKS